MCATRRTTRLAAKASPYHGAVMLYEAKDTLEGEAGPSTRRSRRVKREPGDGESGMDDEKRTLRIQVKAEVEEVAPPKSKPKKPKPIQERLSTPHPAPARWTETYAAIKAMRVGVVAPVDTMGCDRAQEGEVEPANRRFATLVSLMLSSQTKDQVTDAAVRQLRAALGGSVSVRAVLDADEAVVAGAIDKVGFWRRKAGYIKQTAQRLHDAFDDDVPKTVEELCSLPGVGPKMAFLALRVAWQLNAGIGVDVHVHRITNRLGWHGRATKNPEETRLNLESWLPKELHGEINHMLVGFGQTICLPVGPKCGECTLSSAGLCPSAQSSRTRAKTKAVTRKRFGEDGAKIELEMEWPGEGAVLCKEEV